jgi:hypothetical protein
MAQYFSIADGSLSDVNAFGVSLSTADVRNNTLEVPILTSSIYSTVATTQLNTITAIALNLSAINPNTTSNLNVNIQRFNNPSTFINTINNNSVINSIICRQTNFTPFNKNWSVLFFPKSNGSSVIYPYVTLPTGNTNLLLNADFTIETWLYLLSSGDARQSIIQSNWNAAGNSIALWFNHLSSVSSNSTPNKISFWLKNFSTEIPLLTSTTSLVSNLWYHVAVTRASNTFTLYINGNSEDTKTQAVTIGKTLEYIGAYETPSNYLSGYLSDLRIVKGQSLFTGNFTPPTSALALSSVGSTGNVVPVLTGSISLQTFQNNRLIDNSRNNLTVTNNNFVYVQNFSPFNYIYNKELEKGSAYFNEFSDNPNIVNSLTIPHNNNLNFSTLTALTIESWIFLGDVPNNAVFFRKGTFDCFLNQNNGATMTNNGSTSILGGFGNRWKIGEWNHFAFVLSGSYYYLHINGERSSALLNTNAPISNTGTGDIIIGGRRLPDGATAFTNTFFCNYRITKSALYTESFSLTSVSFLNALSALPETCLLLNFDNFGKSNITETYKISSFTKFDGNNNSFSNFSQNWQTLKLTNPLSTVHNDGIIVDLNSNNNNQISLLGKNDIVDFTGYHLISSRGPILLSSVNLPNNTTENAFIFNGTDNWLFTPTANNLLSFERDFTIEFWINTSIFSTDTTYRRVLTFGPNADNNIQLIFSNGNTTAAANTLMVFTNSVIISGTSIVADGNWHHVALSRFNNIMKLFVDGVQSGNSYIAPYNTTNRFTYRYNAGRTNALTIGASANSATGRLTGCLANLHIVNDRALYTTNFVASTQYLSATPNSVLLIKPTKNFNKAVILNNPPLTGALNYSGSIITLSSASPYGNISSGSILLSTNNFLQVTTKETRHDLGWDDFTIEFWYNTPLSTLSVDSSLIGKKQGNANSGWVIFRGANRNHFTLRSQGANTYTDYYSYDNLALSGNSKIDTNTWTHWAISRSLSTLRWYKNGVNIAVSAFNVNVNQTGGTNGIFFIGKGEELTGFEIGCISNIRIVRKTSLYNENFTPPTNIGIKNNTVFLLNTPHSLSGYQYNNGYLDFTDINVGSCLKESNTENITISADSYQINSLSIHNKGTFTFTHNLNESLIFPTSGIQITSEGTMNIGTSSLPISSNRTVQIFANNGIHVHNGGNLNVYGAYKVPYSHLQLDSPATTARFIANQNLSSTWRSGDSVVFTCNLSGLSTYDTLILSGFENDRIFRTTGNSTYFHTALSSNPYVPSISNITRNVSLTSFVVSKGNSKIDINNALFSNLQPTTGFSNNLSGYIKLNNNVYNNYSIRTPFLSSNNITFNNNIFFRNTTQLNYNNLIGSNINITDNMFLNNINTSIGLLLTGISANNLTMSGNYVVGLNGIGTLISNCSTNGTIGGTINFNGTRGVLISGDNIGSISDILSLSSRGVGIYITGNSILSTILTNLTSYNNAQQGIVLSANNNIGNIAFTNIASNNNSLQGIFLTGGNNIGNITFNNVTTNNNTSQGILLSTGSINPTTPTYINLNNTQSNNNKNNSIELYNIYGILSNITFSNNLSSGLRLFIGNNSLINSNITANNNTLDGLFISGISTPLYINLSGIQANNNKTYGIQLLNIRGGNFNSISANNNTLDGLFISATSILSSTNLNQIQTNNNTKYGIRLHNVGGGGNLSNISANNNTLDGLFISGSSTQFSINLSEIQANDNKNYGIQLQNISGGNFNNIIANNNTLNGLIISSNNLNYFTPFFINLKGIQTNNNKYAGIEVYNIIGNLDNITLNNNLSYGLRMVLGNGPTLINNLTSIMISGVNIAILSSYNYDSIRISNSYLSAQTNFANISSNGSILLDSFRLEDLTLNNVNLRQITVLSSLGILNVNNYNINNCNITNSNILVLTATNYNMINVMNGQTITNNHYRILPQGKISFDALNFKTLAPSEKLEPIGTLKSSSKLIGANKGDVTSVSVYVKKSLNYVGNPPRLMLKRNASMGYSNTVLSTSISANNTWELLTGIVPIALNSGIFEVYVECTDVSGSGSINIDEWDFS